MSTPQRTADPSSTGASETGKVRGFTARSFNRAVDTVFDAAERVVSTSGHQVREVDRREHSITVTSRSDTGTPAWTHELGVMDDETGGSRLLVLTSTDQADTTRAERRAARQTDRRLAEEIAGAVEKVPSTPAEAKILENLPGAKRPLLARLTGRHALLGAMVLLVVYAVPLLLVWAIGQAAAAGLLGDARWLPMTLALVLGLGLHIALTVKLGAWVQMVQWGEEYMITFHPVSGYLLGWWRFAVQLASFLLVAFLAADADEVAKERQMTSPETEALPAYAQRAPAPEGSEAGLGADVRQSEYVGRPNATYEVSYAVPATVDLADVEAYLGDPAWADGVDGGEPIGALQEIECGTIPDTCEAEVTPPEGEPVEYTVQTRLSDSYSVTLDNGEDGQLLDVAIEYVEAESR